MAFVCTVPPSNLVRHLHFYDCMTALQVVCGLDHTLALSQAGRAYAFGDNSLCQLGRAGNMGVQTPDTTCQDWIVHDEDREPICFTKVNVAFITWTWLSHFRPL